MNRDFEEGMEQIEERYSIEEEAKIGIAFYKKKGKIMVKIGDKVILS